MATKQQVREQITKVIQEGILTKVLPYQSINGDFDCSIFNNNGTLCGQFDNICDFNNETDGCDTIGNPRCHELSEEQINLALQYGSSCIEDIITAQTYQNIVGDDGQIQVQQNTTGEQVVVYEEDFQTAENDFNRFVDGIVECYTDPDGTIHDFDREFTMNNTDGISFEYASNTVGPLNDDEPRIYENLGVTNHGVDCAVAPISLKNAMIALTQFQSLSNTSTLINPTQAQEILDTTIFELITQQTTRQQRINQFFQDYSELKNQTLPDADGDGVVDDGYDVNSDITTNPDGFIVRLNENVPANDVNENQTLEWLRGDLNQYFLDNVETDEGLPIYQERSSGYLKFREMNQAIIIRNTENLPVINDSETFLTTNQKGFTITMWVKFKDKISSGTLFNYGNPLRETNPYGFMLETYVLNANDDNRDGGNSIADTGENPSYTNWKELANHLGLDYFNNNDEARFLRLVVNSDISEDGTIVETKKLYDSHMVINNDGAAGNLEKQDNFLSITSSGKSRRFIATTNVPIDFNEWYFITATFNPTNDETISNANKLEPLYWTGNLIDPTDPASTTHHSGLGNKCKVEIISKTDLLRARGYQT